MSIRYIGLGASGEIGDSAHYLDIEGTSVLLDAGVHPRYEGHESLPNYDRIRDVDLEAILVSHCHLDHLGSLPVALSYFPHARVFMSDAGAALAPVMLEHTVKVMERLRVEAGIDEYPLYTVDDIDAMSYVFQGMRTDRTFPDLQHTSRGSRSRGTPLRRRSRPRCGRHLATWEWTDNLLYKRHVCPRSGNHPRRHLPRSRRHPDLRMYAWSG